MYIGCQFFFLAPGGARDSSTHSTADIHVAVYCYMYTATCTPYLYRASEVFLETRGTPAPSVLLICINGFMYIGYENFRGDECDFPC